MISKPPAASSDDSFGLLAGAQSAHHTRAEARADTQAHRQRLVLELLAQGITVTTAAREVGMSRRGVYAWREHDPDFAAAWDNAVAAGIEHVEDIVRQHAVKDWRAGEAWLRANAREKWGTHAKADQDVTQKQVIEVRWGSATPDNLNSKSN